MCMIYVIVINQSSLTSREGQHKLFILYVEHGKWEHQSVVTIGKVAENAVLYRSVDEEKRSFRHSKQMAANVTSNQLDNQ